VQKTIHASRILWGDLDWQVLTQELRWDNNITRNSLNP